MFGGQPMSFFEKIQNSINDLSDAKKSVAYYLMEKWLDAAFHSASTVAREVGVSESVVVRFSQDLGYSGFPEIQKELQDILKSRLVNPRFLEEDQYTVKPVSVDDNLDKVYKQSIDNLNKVLSNNNSQTYLEVVNSIIDSKNIIILARKNSLGPANLLNVHINEIFSKSRILNGECAETIDIIRGLTKDDLVITIAIPAYSHRMIYYSDFLVEKQIPQIAITNTHTNAFAKNAKTLLLTSVNSLSFANSHLSTNFIIDTLIYFLTLEKQAEILKSLERMKILNERFAISGE